MGFKWKAIVIWQQLGGLKFLNDATYLNGNA